MIGWRTLVMTLGAAMAAGTSMPALAAPSKSEFLVPPPEPRAVTVQASRGGDADATSAIQSAVDAAAKPGGGGIVFLPSGRYRLTGTVYLWPGVRLYGVGKTRPVLTLADNTPGFGSGSLGVMVFFAGNQPESPVPRLGGVPAPKVAVVPLGSVPARSDVADANSGTFYTAMANIDFEIGAGNEGAVAVREHGAQHAFLQHMDFRLGSALAGVYQVGNLGRNLKFTGGRYGILAEKTSPAWQYTLIDSTFDGQSEAAIREHEAGLTLMNVAIRNVPVAIDIDRGYGDWLWGQDLRLENIGLAGIVISNEGNAYTQVGFQNVVASGTPVFAKFRESGRTVAAPAPRYRVKDFTYGLTVPAIGHTGTYQTRFDAGPIGTLPRPQKDAIPLLPGVAQWTDVRRAGAKGDNAADDTAAIQAAIDANRVVYFPAGFYRVTDRLVLRPDSVLIGLHPSLTQIVLADDSPAFRGVGAARGLIETARGGSAIVSGLGLFTGGINPRAAGAIWRAGEGSLMDDVKFQGGHGTNLFDGKRFDPYDGDKSADADPKKRWDAQAPSLWVTDGGGGTFNGVWTPNTYSQAGLYVTETSTPGRVYQMSAEHHKRAEIVLDRVRNWTFLAPQTEEEVGEGRDTIAVEVRNSQDVLFANLHAYRVTRGVQAAPAAVKLYNSQNIRFRNVHVNAESGIAMCDKEGCGTYLRANKFPFDDAIVDGARGGAVREHEFAVLDIGNAAAPESKPPLAAATKLIGGFHSAGGATVTPDGTLYFIDRGFQRVHRWTADDGLAVIADAPTDAVNLAADAAGKLIVATSAGPDGTVYALDPANPQTIEPLTPVPSASVKAGASIAVPASFWVNGEFRDQFDPETRQFRTLSDLFAENAAAPKQTMFVSADGSAAIPASRVWRQGPADHNGFRWSDRLNTQGYVTGRVGDTVHVANASENVTYRAKIGALGTLNDLAVVAPRGGESVATGPDGRLYVANGQVFVYAADGVELGRIDVPERPVQVLFGGKDGRTLFIVTHHALYSATI